MLLRQGVEHVLNGLFLIHVLFFVRHFDFLLFVFAVIRAVGQLFQRVAVRVHPMRDAQRRVRDDERLAVLVVLASRVLDDLVDQRAGVAARQHKAHFPDEAVLHGLPHLLQAVGKDGKGVQVAALHTLPGRAAGVGVIELRVGVHAAGSVFQQTFADHIADVAVVVVVHHRHHLAIALLECVLRNGQPIVAAGVGFGRPAAAIVVEINHFDLRCSFLRPLSRP